MVSAFKHIIPILLTVVCCAFILPQTQVERIPLKDLDGKTVFLNGISKQKATVLIFLSPECPLCQSYTLTINNLIKKYQPLGIDFIGIVPTKDFTAKSIHDYRITYKSAVKILRDENNELVQLLHATITPEVFILDKNARVLYSGRIDNWAYELGKKRKVITAHNLADAIDATLAGKPVAVPKTKAVGCFIE